MKTISSVIFILIFAITAVAAPFNSDGASAEDFLRVMRQPRATQTWGKMSGIAEHLRRGQTKVTMPIDLNIMFTADRVLSQVVIDHRQGYLVGQTFTGKDSGTSVIPIHEADGKTELLADIGLRPEDLAMSFIYWDFVRELPRESISMRQCRIFLLKKNQELVKLSVDTDYLFPLRVEWYKDEYDASSVAYRTLEATKFKEVDKLWMITRLSVSGPGWRTRIDFDKTEAGSSSEGIPADLFQKTLSSKGKNNERQ